jgi:FkbM family methyltransferase
VKDGFAWTSMSLRQGFSLYYNLFGASGLFLVARSRLSGRNTEVAVSVPGILHPVHLRVRTTDIGVCGEILVKRLYDYKLNAAPRVIIDAGANIGLTSIFYANVYPSARIIAIEPEESNFQMLVKNTSPYPRIEPLKAALWGENCELDLCDPAHGHSAFQTKDRPWPQMVDREKVRGLTLDKLMSDLGINFVDLLKIDIEGAEIEVFADPARWIKQVGVIAIELHDWLRTGCGRSVSIASKDFELRAKNGETTYFAKAGFAPPIPSESQLSDHQAFEPRLPLKILSITQSAV